MPNNRNVFTKKINFTKISFYVFNDLKAEKQTVSFARKLNDKQIMALLRAVHGVDLVESSVEISHFSRVYEMSIEYFTEVAKQIS